MNRFNPDIHHRRSVRLKGFDYSQPAAYFITICTRDRVSSLGDVVEGVATLSAAGSIVQNIWDSLPDRFPNVAVDAFIVMPNHVHGILIVGTQFLAPKPVRQADVQSVGAQFIAPRTVLPPIAKFPDGAVQGAMNRAPTLGECVRAFKAASTRLIRVGGFDFAWQRGFYERVIRDENELRRVQAYIEANPANWDTDEEHVRNTS
jgi:REP element-mobilizing transposase RayT